MLQSKHKKILQRKNTFEALVGNKAYLKEKEKKTEKQHVFKETK